MIKKILNDWSLRRWEKEITSFLNIFHALTPQQNSVVVGMAALFHHQFMSKDPKFEMLLKSPIGINQGEISIYILQLNSLINQFQKSGQLDEAAAMTLWKITFRCMVHEKFNRYGKLIWAIASLSFNPAENWLKEKLEASLKKHSPNDVPNLQAALTLHDYIPAQFK